MEHGIDTDNADAAGTVTGEIEAFTMNYETKLHQSGYAAPTRMAKALRAVVPDTDLPTLDFGCATGLLGLELRLNGFRAIDATDASPRMLAAARGKGFYHRTWLLRPDADPLFPPGSYPVIAALDVIGPDAAPPATIDRLMQLLPTGGLLAFSLLDKGLADNTHAERVTEWVDRGAARLLFAEAGPHLRASNNNSTIYIVEKL